MPELRPYQVAGVEFLREAYEDPWARVRLLCDEMGLGKTPQATMAWPGSPWDTPEPGVVVVCPAGLRSVWQRHVREWRPDLRPVVVRDTSEIQPPRIGEVVIVSPDALGWAAGAEAKGWRGEGAITAATSLRRFQAGLASLGDRLVITIDEAHRLKGATAQKASTVGAFVRPAVARGATCFALTATPMPRDAADIWCLAVRLGIEGHPLAWRGRSQAGWQQWARANGRAGRWTCAATPASPLDHPDALGHLLLRRLVADHLPEIPPPTHAIRLVSISAEIRSEADEILRHACASIGVDIRRVSRESVDGPDEVDEKLFREIGRTRRGDLAKMETLVAAAKIPAVLEEVERCQREGEPVLVYSEHRAPIDALAKAGHPVIVGGVPQKKRAAIADSFQDGEVTVLGFTGAGREGITLTRASTFIEADTNWSADDRDQALGRAHRFGREGSVSVIHVLADHPVERLKMRVLRRKRTFKLAALGSSL